MYTSHELARIAADAARQVGPYLIEAFSRPRTVELKADFHDVVTVHDKESQRRIADFLFAETPESFIVGEESSRMLTCDGRPGTPGEGDVVWYVDPIDGTSNFASGFDHWCVSIAAARGGAEAEGPGGESGADQGESTAGQGESTAGQGESGGGQSARRASDVEGAERGSGREKK